MAKEIDWDSRIGRRVRLRDLYVLTNVVQCGSMAKAATQLRVTQSAVSQMIADLEHAVGVRLLDRSPRGIEATKYGATLLKRGRAVFDELRQWILEIEFLSDPTAGEIRIGCPESLAAAILPIIIERFTDQHPRVLIDVDTAVTGATSAPKLRDRNVDLVLARGGPGLAELSAADDMKVEVFFDDKLVIAAGAKSRWARRRKLNVDELADAPWIVTPYGWRDEVLPEVFRKWNVERPNIRVKTFSIHIRANLIASGAFVTALPLSVFKFYGSRLGLKALPIALPRRPWPVAMVTLKNRALSPVVERFMDCARAVAKSLDDGRR